MKKSFIGQDKFIWWIGVIESRQDPLKLGRCKVRIFGWHKDSVTEQPTESLPWAYPIIPLDHGKNTLGPREGDWIMGFFADAEVAQKPMMMGILPGMNESTAPDPKEQIGHQDLRPNEVLKGHQQPYPPRYYDIIQFADGSGTTITEYELKSRYPDDKILREAETSRYARGFTYGVILKTSNSKKTKKKELKLKDPKNPLNVLLDPETLRPQDRKFISDLAQSIGNELGSNGQDLAKDVPQELLDNLTTEVTKQENEPQIELGSILFQNIDGDITTSEGKDKILRSGGYTAAGTVLWEQDGDIFLVDVFGKFKNNQTAYTESGYEYTIDEVIPQPMGHLYRTLLRPKILNLLQQKYIPIGEHLEASGEFAVFPENMGGSFSEPFVPYNTQYPYNHVYESESGHLLEFDDTPGFERIHLIHRSGTFEEIHPSGLKVSKTVNDDYRYYLKNEYKHTEGKAYHTIDKGLRILVNGGGGPDNHYNICVGPGSNLNITTADGQVNFYSTKEFQIFCDSDVNIDCENLKIHTRADTIIHTEGDADWHVEGDMRLRVDGSFYQSIGEDKITVVGGNYEKTVGGDYPSGVGGFISETSGSYNKTQAASSISELSGTSNTRTSGISITDTTITNTAISAFKKNRYTGGDVTDVAGNKHTFLTNYKTHITNDLSLQIAGTDVQTSPTGIYPYGSLTITGFITSNGITHGSGDV